MNKIYENALIARTTLLQQLVEYLKEQKRLTFTVKEVAVLFNCSNSSAWKFLNDFSFITKGHRIYSIPSYSINYEKEAIYVLKQKGITDRNKTKTPLMKALDRNVQLKKEIKKLKEELESYYKLKDLLKIMVV